MKILLIIVNLFLAGMVVREGVALLRPSGGETLELVRRERPAASKKTAQPATPVKGDVAIDPLRTVLRHNIFDMSRCPDAIAGRRGASGSSISLVGVYQIGDCVGAIIQQKRQNNRRGPWRNNRSNNNSKPELPLQQFFRVGESLENGYRLEEVYPDRVVLRRNGGSMELRLENASTNLPSTVAAAAAAAQRNRPTQQQMQQMMMFQQMRMMRELIRQNNNNRAPAPPQSGGRRGRR